jgi:polar amino acid transport system substrate-binding protein
MKRRALLAMPLASLAGCAAGPGGDEVRRALAPGGVLRAGVSVAPAASVSFAVRDAAGELAGPPAEVIRALARKYSLVLSLVGKEGSGQLAEAMARGELDLAFLPPDLERRATIDFGPSIFEFESTFLVRADLALKTMQDVDRPDLRILGIANTATVRVANANLKRVQVQEVGSVTAAVQRLQSGSADALALGRQPLTDLLPRLPGFIVLEGAFQRAFVALGIPKGRPVALEAVRAYSEDAKSSGAARRILDSNGLRASTVAAATER